MDWYLKVMQDNYANFNGRARRKEYWMFYLFYILILIAAMMADNILGLSFSVGSGRSEIETGYGWLYIITVLAHAVPSFACAVRRLHDTGKSGWFLLLSFIPIIGTIILLVFLCIDGDSGDNAHGPSPKADPSVDDGVEDATFEEVAEDSSGTEEE